MVNEQPLAEQLKDYIEAASEIATIDDFYDHIGIPIEDRNDFATAASLNQHKET